MTGKILILSSERLRFCSQRILNKQNVLLLHWKTSLWFSVEDFRTLIGATNPAEAAEGTIRKLYAASIGENAVHGSDSDENAEIEGAFHFSGREMF